MIHVHVHVFYKDCNATCVYYVHVHVLTCMFLYSVFISNTELRSVWIDLLTRDSNLLDKFEVFLMNVVEDLGKSHSDIEHIEKRMKQ